MQVYFGRKPAPNVNVCISSPNLVVIDKVKLPKIQLYSKANRKLFMLRKLKEAGLDKEDLLTV